MFSQLEDFRFARWAKGLNRSVQILLSLTLVATLNILAATHFQRWDLTANRRYSLSPETLSFLKKIPRTPDMPVQISLILPGDQQDEYNRVILDQIRTLLKEYAFEGRQLTGSDGRAVLITEEIDPLIQVEKLRALAALGYKPTPQMAQRPQIVVMRGKRGHIISMADLYDTKRDDLGESATGFKGENAVTSAILDVIQAKPDQILFTVGHGEMSLSSSEPTSGLSELGRFLQDRNYAFSAIDLAKDEKISDEAKLVVVANPIVPFQPYEVEKLRRYLNDKNGRVMVFLEPGGGSSGLDGLLKEWGLRSNNWFIGETRQNLTGDGQIMIDPSQDPKRRHQLTNSLVFEGLGVVFGATRPVEIDESAPPDDRRQVHELLATSKGSGAISAAEFDADPHAMKLPGPFAVAALSERLATDAVGLPPGGRLLVFGDAEFIANKNFNSYGNQELILNCVNYLADRKNMLNIPPKAPNQTKLNITGAQFTGLAWRLAIVPAVLAMLGMAVFWVRNRT